MKRKNLDWARDEVNMVRYIEKLKKLTDMENRQADLLFENSLKKGL